MMHTLPSSPRISAGAIAALALAATTMPAFADGATAGDATRTLLVSDYIGDKIIRYEDRSPDRSQPYTPVDHFVGNGISPMNGPDGLALSNNGQILYAANGVGDAIETYNPETGEYLGRFAGPPLAGLVNPVDMAISASGDVYVTDGGGTDDIYRYNLNGTLLGVLTVGGAFNDPIDRPQGITFGPDGKLYVADADDDLVRRINPTTGVVEQNFGVAPEAGYQMDFPQRLAFGPDGKVYVTAGASNNVIRIDTQTGDTEQFITPGLGGLGNPIGLAFDDEGYLLVVSDNNFTVLEYTPLGAFSRAAVLAGSGGLQGAGINAGPVDLLFLTFPTPQPCSSADRVAPFGVLNFADVQSFIGQFGVGCP